jgi:hypothetical protein
LKFLLNNGNEDVGGHGPPDSRLDFTLALDQKLLDAQLLFDTFEKQSYILGVIVKRSDGQRRQACVVRQKDQNLMSFAIFEPDTMQVFDVVFGNVVSVQCNELIADNAPCPVDFSRVHSVCVILDFGASLEESSGLMHLEWAHKVYIDSIHDIKRHWPQDKDTEHFDLVHFAVADYG